MKKSKIIIAIFAATLFNAQTKKQQDIQSIKSMCGCYEVSFNFAETFNYSNEEAYKASEVKHDTALEWAFPLEESTDNDIKIQHLLIVGPPNKPMIIKHWRQDWLYQNTDLYEFNGDNNWKYIKKNPSEVKGQWTQKVYQVDDSPRYEGSATWVHVDGKDYWENTTPAPLPRREYTKRDDYNITLRTNRQEITDGGWIHDQDNAKIIRKAGQEDIVLAEEKGHNIYTKVDDSKCQAAQDWWKSNKNKWKLVRNNWQNVYNRNKNLELKSTVDNKPLFMHLFPMKENANNREIQQTITSFVK